MDANRTRYHLLLGEDDWLRCERDGAIEWAPTRQQIALEALVFHFVAAAADRAPTVDDRRGAARDRYGNWYWISRSARQVYARSAGSEAISLFWSDEMQSHVTASKGRTDASSKGDFAPKEAPSSSTVADLRFGGLAVTDDHYLVVGTSQPGGALVFDLHAGGAPQWILFPSTIDFAPFDMAAMVGGGVCILDRSHKRFWALDRGFNVINNDQSVVTLRPEAVDDFQPKDRAPDSALRHSSGRTFPTGVTGDAATPLSGLDPVAIEALPDGTVLILDNSASDGYARIHRYRFGQRLGNAVSTSVLADKLDQDARVEFSLIAHDFAFVAEHQTTAGDDADVGATVPDQLFVVSAGGNQSFVFDLYTVKQNPNQLRLEPVIDYLPMRLYAGRALVAADGRAWYDFGEEAANGAATRWLPLMAQRRPRFAAQGTIVTPIFDGREPNCVWHRIMLDGCIPPETSVTVYSRAANEKSEFAAEWEAEPALYLRSDGSELPFAARPVAAATARSMGIGTWEALFQRARGRYLQVKLVLVGNGRSTPQLRALRAYYPRFSYAAYLPAIYRDPMPLLEQVQAALPSAAHDGGCADAYESVSQLPLGQRRPVEQSFTFLERFLANLEGINTAIEDKIAAVQLLFDVRSAPASVLEWLAQWFGIALDPVWDDAKRRLFIRHAMTFFQFRGTVFGLKMALRLALDECADESIFDLQQATATEQFASIRIAEAFRSRSLDRTRSRAEQRSTSKAAAHRFTVQLPVAASGQANDPNFQQRLELARRIIALEKPVHTIFDIQFYWAMFRVGEARLGADTLVGHGGRAPELMPPLVLGQGYLMESSLTPSHPQTVPQTSALISGGRSLVVGRDGLVG